MICEYIDCCWTVCHIRWFLYLSIFSSTHPWMGQLLHEVFHWSIDSSTRFLIYPLIHSLGHTFWSEMSTLILEHLHVFIFLKDSSDMEQDKCTKYSSKQWWRRGKLVALKIIEKSVTHDGLLILSFFVVRRIPWIRGMTQIFMIKSISSVSDSDSIRKIHTTYADQSYISYSNDTIASAYFSFRDRLRYWSQYLSLKSFTAIFEVPEIHVVPMSLFCSCRKNI